MLFVDDIALIDETCEGINAKLESQPKKLEVKRFKLSKDMYCMEFKYNNSRHNKTIVKI